MRTSQSTEKGRRRRRAGAAPNRAPAVTFAAALTILAAAVSACTASSLGASAPTTTETLAPPTTADPATSEPPVTAPATITTLASPAPVSQAPGTAPPAITQTAGAGPCHARIEYGYVLPDPVCTPGATNPQVTQADIGQTICTSGWTKTVRPPESYTEPLKRSQMSEYGETGPISNYEEDHLIPLELGGAPSDPHNLWPEPGSSPNPKDDVESAANRAVCNGTMPLASAQHQIATDWVAFGRYLGVIAAPGSQSP